MIHEPNDSFAHTSPGGVWRRHRRLRGSEVGSPRALRVRSFSIGGTRTPRHSEDAASARGKIEPSFKRRAHGGDELLARVRLQDVPRTPKSSAFRRTARLSWTVTNTIRASGRAARIDAAAASPLTRGIAISQTIASGRARCVASISAIPSCRTGNGQAPTQSSTICCLMANRTRSAVLPGLRT